MIRHPVQAGRCRTNSQGSNLKQVHLCTCVWGTWHVEVLSKIMWPCLLAERNLPAFMRQCRAVYRLCTTRRDQQQMRSMPVFAAISKLVDVQFIDTPAENPEPIFHMHRFFQALAEARDEDAIFFNLWPDVVFTDRTLGSAAEILGSGVAGCVIPTVRVVSETCAKEIMEDLSDPPGAPMAISPGEAARLGVKHLHPLCATSVAGGRHGRPDIGMLFRVPGEGMVARTLDEWLFVDPRRLSIENSVVTTDDPDPGRLIHIASDSDDMFFLSLAPLFKELEIFRPDHPNQAIDIARMTMHPMHALSPFYDHFDRVCTRLHYGPMTETLWEPVVRRSEAAFRRVRMLRAFLRIWALAKSQGCQQAARIMSAALFNLKLPAGWLIDQPVTIFVPNDAAMASIPAERRLQLLDRRYARKTVEAMLSHVVLGSGTMPTDGGGEHRSLTGEPIHIERHNGAYRINERAKVVADLRSGPHRVCIIDQCLEPRLLVH